MATEDISQKASAAAAKAKDFVEQNADKIQEALKSDQAEQISDGLLDKVAGFADKVTGGKHSDAIKDARDKIDGSIGNN